MKRPSIAFPPPDHGRPGRRGALLLLFLMTPLVVASCGGGESGSGPGDAPTGTGEAAEDLSVVRASERRFASSGRDVPVTVILPAGAGEHPMVILLHGRSGPSFYGERLEALGRRLADAGIGAMIPSYFATTDDEADPPVTDARFRVWRWTLADAVAAAGAVEHVDAERIGVAGFSLGGYLAVTEAAGNPDIRAVAANSTGASPYLPNELERFPPLLVIHASGDPLVPLASAEELVRQVRALGIDVETEIFPAESHVLEGEDWDRAADRMIEFFRRTLAGA